MTTTTPAKPAGPAFRLPALSGPVLGLVVVVTVFVALVWLRGNLRTFLSVENGQVLLHGNLVTAVVALGALLVIISGGIDLSVGSVVALVTVATMWAYRLVYAGPGAVPLLGDGWAWHGTASAEWASVAALAAGLATGGLCGLANGCVITGLRLPPFVATLGMMSVARGLAYWLAEGRPLTFPSGGRPGWVGWLASTSPPYYAGFPPDFGNLPWWQQAGHLLLAPLLAPPVGFWSLALLALLAWALLRYTVLGRYCYAIGSSEATARLCGVPVGRSKVAVYTLAGLLAGWAGVLSFANVDSGDPGGNFGLELIVIASVVIGGARLSGGQGTVAGTLLGVLILGVLENGVTAFQVPVEVKYILIGAIIIANTALSQWQRR